MEPGYIGKERVNALLPMEECIQVMEDAFRAFGSGEVVQPLRSLMWLPDRSGLLGIMPGYAGGAGIMGAKLVSVFHGNKEAGIPSHQGVVALFEAIHGRPLLMLDAEAITSTRTAAVSALATRLLSRENSEILAILGTGEQAARHIEAINCVREIREINVWGRSENNAVELANRIQPAIKSRIKIMSSVEEAVANADIICTVTSASQPVLEGRWIPPGAHINAVGACTPGVRELDSAALVRSVLFTDCYASIFNEAGDFLIPKREGLVTDDHVRGELSELISGSRKGRKTATEVTVFKSLGIAIEDLFSAWHIYKKLKAVEIK